MDKKQLRVLMVEDDPTDREALERFVTRQNLPYEIDSVESKKEFLLKLQQNKYDVILMDYKLPDSSGVDLLQVAGGTPVVMVTGSGDEKIAVESIRKGAYDYLVKDQNRNYLDLLPITIENVLARKKMETVLEAERQRLFSLLDELPGFVYLHKPDHSIAFSNRRFQELFGDPRGKPCYEVIKKKKEPCKCPTSKVHDSKIPQEWEWTSSAGRTYQIYDYPFTDTDGSSLVLKLGMDITERKRAEEEKTIQTKAAVLSAEVDSAITGSNSLRNLLQSCAEAIVRNLKMTLARIWTVNWNKNMLELQASAGIYTHIDGDHARLPVGKLKIGLIVKDRKPFVTNNVLNDIPSIDKDWAKREGMVAFAGYPLIVSNQVIGVIGTFSQQPLLETTLKSLSTVASGIAIGTKRIQAEEALYKKTKFIQLSHEITLTANEAPTVEGALQVCLDKVCKYMNWPVGHVYITDSKGILIPSKIWHIEKAERFEVFRKVTENTSFDTGVGLPGRVLATGKPGWIADVTHDQNFPRAKLAKDIGVKAAFALPVLEEEKVVAVLEFFAEEAVEPDEPTLEALSNLAVQVGRVTERKRAEEALKKSEKRFQQLFTNMLNGFAIHEIVVNEDNKPIDYIFLEVNDTFETMTGLKRAEIVGKKVTEVLPGIENDPVDWIGVYGKVALTGEDARFEQYSEFLGKWYLVYSYRLQENQFAVIFEDVTERKRAEEERENMEEKLRHAQKLESLGVLAGGIAHDFNNILTGILGNAELALDNLSPDSPLRNYIEEIEKGAKRAAELSQEMLAYSGKGKFVIQNIDLNELIKEMIHMLNVSISKKHSIKYDLSENLPSVEVDMTQIRQVIMNLIINASEAIGGNVGVISITTGAMECDKDYFKKMYLHEELTGGLYNCIEVADTGAGMDKNIIEKMFDPFFTTKFTGRGLGMSAVLGIIRGHKGAINVESEPGKGTKFTVFLPASGKAASTAKSGREETAAPWRGSGTVLVVDDEKAVREVGKSMLERMGFNVITASDGQEAVEIFRDRSNEIDCVLLDLTMPRMNGEESFIELRKIRKDIRVIIYSGYSEEATIHRFINQGVNEFIQKPFNLKTLRNKMRKVFESN